MHKVCCLCECTIEGYGNNPDGAAYKDESGEIVFPTFGIEDRCCDGCNEKYVIPGRIYSMLARREENA